MDNCIFCKIVKGDIPSIKIHEDNDFLAFMDIHPVSKGHALIVTKDHIRWMQDSEDNTISNIFVLAKTLMKKMVISLPCDYVQVSVVGEEVEHFHIHLIPRFHNDGLAKWETIKYDFPSEIESYADKIKN